MYIVQITRLMCMNLQSFQNIDYELFAYHIYFDWEICVFCQLCFNYN